MFTIAYLGRIGSPHLSVSRTRAGEASGGGAGPGPQRGTGHPARGPASPGRGGVAAGRHRLGPRPSRRSGSDGGVAAICGAKDKTVMRVIQRAEAGGVRPDLKLRSHNYEVGVDLVA